jgi:hypothetical protein
MKTRVAKMPAQHTDFLLYSQRYRLSQVKAWFSFGLLKFAVSSPFGASRLASPNWSLLTTGALQLVFSRQSEEFGGVIDANSL